MNQPIIMIHGAFSSPYKVWGDFITFFEGRNHRCLPVELPFHNEDYRQNPPRELGRKGLMDYAEHVRKKAEAFRRNTKKDPIIIGHSMGGTLAQIVVSRGMVKAKALVLISPFPPRGISLFSSEKAEMSPSLKVLTSILLRRPMMMERDEAYRTFFNKIPEERKERLYQELVPESSKAISQLVFSALDFRRTSEIYPENVNVPLLVVVGKEDRAVPPDLQEKLLSLYHQENSGASPRYLMIAEDHGHWIMQEPGWWTIAADIYSWIIMAEEETLNNWI